MTEFYFRANSNAAPFFSDTTQGFVSAYSAEEALLKVIGEYSHPMGLFAVSIYSSADAGIKGLPALATWRSEAAIKQALQLVGDYDDDDPGEYIGGGMDPRTES